jgi:hypothetical protein
MKATARTAQLAGTICAISLMTMPAAAQVPGPVVQDRVSGTEKGSILYFSKVEIRWTVTPAIPQPLVALSQDTFIQLCNDNIAGTAVQMYFINGDPPLAAVANGERAHPGWNWVDNLIYLTQNQPTYWSALTGIPGPSGSGVSPFTALDPGSPPGRPDPEGGTDRVLRGFIIAFAVNPSGEEVKWNHLAGDATHVNYADQSAWQFNAWAFQSVNAALATGAQTGTPGILNMDGVDFAPCYSDLLMNFQAVGSSAYSGGQNQVVSDTDLTLHLVSADLRQETTGPVTTKASFDIWNQNEVKFSGTDRCVTCWDQRLLSHYNLPNHFLLQNLQSHHGKARINGLASQLCNTFTPQGFPVIVSQAAALLGVAAKHLVFNSGMPNIGGRARAGGNLIGMGTETAVIQYDFAGGPPPEDDKDPASAEEWIQYIQSQLMHTSVSVPH